MRVKDTFSIKYVAVHHFGGTLVNRWAKTQDFTEKRIENGFSARWNFPSELNGSNIGYNVIIWADGTYKQYRLIGEETAAQIGHNSDTFSICLAGNFTLRNGIPVEKPTYKQVKTLTKLLEKSYDNLGVKLRNFRPHRGMTYSHTECYGNSLTNDWVRNLLVPYLQNKLASFKLLLSLYMKFINLMEKLDFHKLGGKINERSCMGHV